MSSTRELTEEQKAAVITAWESWNKERNAIMMEPLEWNVDSLVDLCDEMLLENERLTGERNELKWKIEEMSK